jgi:hypothetical protein
MWCVFLVGWSKVAEDTGFWLDVRRFGTCGSYHLTCGNGPIVVSRRARRVSPILRATLHYPPVRFPIRRKVPFIYLLK